jgi:hypothetical protein
MEVDKLNSQCRLSNSTATNNNKFVFCHLWRMSFKTTITTVLSWREVWCCVCWICCFVMNLFFSVWLILFI